jgi:hypothetical protein
MVSFHLPGTFSHTPLQKVTVWVDGIIRDGGKQPGKKYSYGKR